MSSVGKRLYRIVVPESVRRSGFVRWTKQHLLGHDWVYNADYYARTVEGPATRSAATIADSIAASFGIGRVLDVGCGTGALLEALRTHGYDVFGLEYSEAAIQYCKSRRLSVEKFDLEKDVFDSGRVFDIAISMEVAEHLPVKAVDRYVTLLARAARTIVFTAAAPGQGGEDHVNEQPQAYWIAKFAEHGFECDQALSQDWRRQWVAAGNVESWYHRNLMIFQRVH